MIDHAAIAAAVSQIPATWLRERRWFGAKSRPIAALETVDWAPIPGDEPAVLLLARVRYADGGGEVYALPLLASFEPRLSETVAAATMIETRERPVFVYDALIAPAVRERLLQLLLDAAELRLQSGRFVFQPEAELLRSPPPLRPSRLLGVEQSNSALVYDAQAMLKLFRRVVPGLNPDVEVGRYLSRAGFDSVPAVLGAAVYIPDGGVEHSLALAQEWVPNRGDAWDLSLARLTDFYAAVPDGDATDDVRVARHTAELAREQLGELRQLGRLTGELHLALARPTDDQAFAPRPITDAMVDAWKAGIRELRDATLPQLTARAEALDAEQREVVAWLSRAGDRIEATIAALDGLAARGVVATRFHGDYHLGQILVGERGYLVIDFEGEPMRSLAERRAHGSPLKDVAGMLRSLGYAASAALFAAEKTRPAPALARYAVEWERQARRAFEDGYFGIVPGARFLPADDRVRDAALRAFELEKALYELAYELNNRPDWLPIPLRGITGAIGARHEARGGRTHKTSGPP